MSRRTRPLICSKSDIIELEAAAGDTSNPRVATRAKMVLECAKGQQIKDVASMFSERPNTVIKWKQRYEEFGVSGLSNAPRGSTKDVYGEPFAKRLRELLDTDPPDGEEYWTGPLLAEALGTPKDTIRRYLRREHIQLLEYRRRVKSNTLPDDSEDNTPCDHGVTQFSERESENIIGDLPEEESGSVNEENSNNKGSDLSCILHTETDVTYEKHMCVSITSYENIHEVADRSVDICIHVKLMDGDVCIQESLSSFPSALPRFRQFDVKINDTS